MTIATSALKSRYEKLTPFERAALILREAVGRRRRSVGEALTAKNPFQGYWQMHWEDAVLLTTAFAVYQITVSWLASATLQDVAAEEDCEDPLTRAWSWALALERLERETGAPFTRCEEFFCSCVVARTLEAVRRAASTLGETDLQSLACPSAYEKLRGYWDMHCRDVNGSDGWRLMPPVAPAAPRPEDDLDDGDDGPETWE